MACQGGTVSNKFEKSLPLSRRDTRTIALPGGCQGCDGKGLEAAAAGGKAAGLGLVALGAGGRPPRYEGRVRCEPETMLEYAVGGGECVVERVGLSAVLGLAGSVAPADPIAGGQVRTAGVSRLCGGATVLP